MPAAESAATEAPAVATPGSGSTRMTSAPESAPPREQAARVNRQRAIACLPANVASVRLRFRVAEGRITGLRSTTPELAEAAERCLLRLYEGTTLSGSELVLRR